MCVDGTDEILEDAGAESAGVGAPSAHPGGSLTARLVGDWYRSHEEDAGGCAVFRPALFNFPRARMPRRSLHFGPDGAASIGQPGSDDRRVQQPARWSLAQDILTIDSDGMCWVYRVEIKPDGTLLREVPREGDTDAHQERR